MTEKHRKLSENSLGHFFWAASGQNCLIRKVRVMKPMRALAGIAGTQQYMTDHGMKSCNTSFKLSNSFNHHFKHLLTNTWNLGVNSFVPYFIHIIVSFAHLCLKVLGMIHLQWE